MGPPGPFLGNFMNKRFLVLTLLGVAVAAIGFSGGFATAADNIKLFIRTVNQASIIAAASTDLTIGTTTSTSSIKMMSGTTQGATFVSGGVSFPTAGTGLSYPAAAVITPATALTPVSGARIANQKVGLIATAAPTAVFVFAQPTISVGKSFEVYNQGASPAQILPEDGTINVTAAFTPFACATQKLCECQGVSTTQMLCQAK